MEPERLAEIDEAQYVEAFVSSTRDTLFTMASVETMCTEKATDVAGVISDNALSAMMVFRGLNDGYMALIIKEDLAGELVANILGREPDQLSPRQVADGVVEIVNVIAGNAKAKLHGTAYHFDMTIPTIGDVSDLREPETGGILHVLVFETLDRAFTMVVNQKPRGPAETPETP